MYIDLRSKLEMYKKGQVNNQPNKKFIGPDIHEVIHGTICNNEWGSFYLIEKRYPLNHDHGGYNLGQAVEMDYSPMSKLFSASNPQICIKDLVFLDTETTGLSGGTGTVAFLIGAGFFENDAFILQQYFMRDYNEEPAMLKNLNDVLISHKGLVTFNGKAFDWNLLETRFTSSRMRIGLRDTVHIDLLYPSRMLWKLKYESCRLSALEENILKIRRIDDIPGYMIPGVYFKYLEDRNASEIKKVISHNEKDILSMVSLMARINSILGNPLNEARDAWELLGAGRLFERREDCNTAIVCYNKCTTSVNQTVRDMSLKKLAYIHKRNKDYSRATEYLESLLSCSKTPNIPAMIELAKLYEHRIKDIPKALSVVHEAVNFCSQAGFIRNLYYNDLKMRIERLKRKTLS